MSVFALDPQGADQLDAQARANPFDPSQLHPGFFDDVLSATGQGVLRGGVKAGTLQTVGSEVQGNAYRASLAFADPSRDVLKPLPKELAPQHTAAQLRQDAIDYWTPDPSTVGTAGRVLGGFGEIVLPLAAGGGNPSLLAASQTVDTTLSLSEQGVDPHAAVTVGGLSGAATLAGFKIPAAFGTRLLTRLATGAAGNTAINAATTEGQRLVLEHAGATDAAAQFDPTDPTQLTVDTLSGLLFGGIHHLGNRHAVTPAERDAMLATANAQHYDETTMPGEPTSPDAAVQHVDAMDTAMQQVLADQPVQVDDKIDASLFRGKGDRSLPEVGALIDRRLAALDEVAAQALPKEQVKALASEAGELEDLLRGHYAARAAGVTAAPSTSLTPSELAFAEERLATIRSQLEAHKHGQGAATAVANLRAKLGNIDTDAELRALADTLAPDYTPAPRTPQVEGYDAFRRALESGGNPEARATGSTAVGADQFTEGTWLRLVQQTAPEWAQGKDRAQILAARTDPAKSAEIERALRVENAAALEQAGQPVTPENLYAAHFFGAKRGVAFAQADDATPVDTLLSKAQIKANPELAGKTKAQVLENWRARARQAGVMLPAELDAPNFGLPEAPTSPEGEAILAGIPEQSTHAIDTPERQTLRQQLVDEHFTDAQPVPEGQRPIAYVMGGGGASGKGTLLRQLQDAGYIPERGAVHIDPDAIKAGEHGLSGIPEYRALVDAKDSRAAAVVHEESSQIAQQVRERAVTGRYNLILDRTLGDPAKAVKELQALKDAGYEIRLRGITVDPGEAVRRAVKRAQDKGRYVPLDRLLQAHKGFAQGFEDYVRLADNVALYDNSGTSHRRIASAMGGRLAVADERAYNQFRGRRQINDQATSHRELQLRGRAEGDRRGHAGGLGESPGSARPVGAGSGRPQRLEAGDRGTGPTQGGPEGVTADPADALLAQSVQDVLTQQPDLLVPDENGNLRPAAELLAEGQSDAAQAETLGQAVQAAAACMLRNPE